mgnify:CR=1 FL=1
METGNMDSLKQLIIKYCEGKGGWVYGGQIEDMIRSEYGNKASNASRRCRELVNSGILEKSLVQIDGKGPKVVRYRAVEEKEECFHQCSGNCRRVGCNCACGEFHEVSMEQSRQDDIQENTDSMEEKLQSLNL